MNALSHPITAAPSITLAGAEALHAVVKPFVMARFNCLAMPRRSAIDIRTDGVARIDADVRKITKAGISVFWWNDCDFIPWVDVRGITVRALDERGNTVASREYDGAAMRGESVL